MAGAKTGVATRINEIESHAHLTHYNGHALETKVQSSQVLYIEKRLVCYIYNQVTLEFLEVIIVCLDTDSM